MWSKSTEWPVKYNPNSLEVDAPAKSPAAIVKVVAVELFPSTIWKDSIAESASVSSANLESFNIPCNPQLVVEPSKSVIELSKLASVAIVIVSGLPLVKAKLSEVNCKVLTATGSSALYIISTNVASIVKGP